MVVENATISSLVKQVFTLDPLYKKEDLDGVKLPRTNLRPDLVPGYGNGDSHRAWFDPCRVAKSNRPSSQLFHCFAPMG